LLQIEIFQDKDLANKISKGGFRTARKYDISESREKFLEAVKRSEDEKVSGYAEGLRLRYSF